MFSEFNNNGKSGVNPEQVRDPAVCKSVPAAYEFSM